MADSTETQIQAIERLKTEARTAIANRDATSARWIVAGLLAELATIPDGKKDGNAGAELSFERDAINNLIDQLKSLQRDASISGGIAVSQAQYTRCPVGYVRW